MRISSLLAGASPLRALFLTWKMVGVCALMIGVAVLAAFVRSPWFRGWIGELQVGLAIRLLLDKRSYRLLRNVTVPAEDGTTQIDHVVLSRFGIFVIETKNMSGWIFGSERDRYWTQKFPRRSHKFQNPLRQNYKHTRTLSELLGLRHDLFRSIVVFVGSARIKTQVPANVTGPGGLIRYIKSHRCEVMTAEEVTRTCDRLAALRLRNGLATHIRHVRHVRRRVARRNHPRGG